MDVSPRTVAVKLRYATGVRQQQRSARETRDIVRANGGVPFLILRAASNRMCLVPPRRRLEDLTRVARSLAPVVIVSCAATLRDILAGNGCGASEPYVNGMHMLNAKAHLLGCCIDLLIDHSFIINTSGALYIDSAGGSLPSTISPARWRGRLTMEPVSSRKTDMSSHKSISKPFA